MIPKEAERRKVVSKKRRSMTKVYPETIPKTIRVVGVWRVFLFQASDWVVPVYLVQVKQLLTKLVSTVTTFASLFATGFCKLKYRFGPADLRSLRNAGSSDTALLRASHP